MQRRGRSSSLGTRHGSSGSARPTLKRPGTRSAGTVWPTSFARNPTNAHLLDELKSRLFFLRQDSTGADKAAANRLFQRAREAVRRHAEVPSAEPLIRSQQAQPERCRS
jgi:hypothetical protein